MKTHKLNSTSNNNRLAEMGFVKGAIFRIVKKVSGMFQLRTSNSNDVVIREDIFKDIEYYNK